MPRFLNRLAPRSTYQHCESSSLLLRISVRTAVVIATTQVAVVGPRAHNRVESGTNEQPCSCCYGTDLKARPLHLISQRPILGHCLNGTLSLAATVRDYENPAKHYAAKNQTDSRKTLVGRVIAISRTPPWLASGWGCRGRRLSRGQRSPGTHLSPWLNRLSLRRLCQVGDAPAPPAGNLQRGHAV